MVIHIGNFSIQHGLHAYFLDLTTNYLTLQNSLRENHLKVKHHILLHYAQMMERLGPLRSLSTMRCEGKNKDLKGCAKSSLSRLNSCKTIATKCQLQENYRSQLNHSVDHPLSYEKNGTMVVVAEHLSQFSCYANLLHVQAEELVTVIDSLSFRGREVNENVIIMIPNVEGISMFVVHTIILDQSQNLHLISRI